MKKISKEKMDYIKANAGPRPDKKTKKPLKPSKTK